MTDENDLTDEAKREIAAAIAIVKEDKIFARLHALGGKPADPTDPPKTDPPKTDPPKSDPPKTDPPKTDPPPPPKTEPTTPPKKKGLWWGDQITDDPPEPSAAT